MDQKLIFPIAMGALVLFAIFTVACDAISGGSR